MVKNIISLTLLAFFFMAVYASEPDRERVYIDEVHSLSGKHLPFLYIAYKRFKKEGYSIEDFNVILLEKKSSHAVIFEHKSVDKYQFGSSHEKPVFEVQISNDFELINAYYAR